MFNRLSGPLSRHNSPVKVRPSRLLLVRNILIAVTFAFIAACGGLGAEQGFVIFVPDSISVVRGDTQEVTLRVVSRTEFGTTVGFRISRLPSGVTAILDPPLIPGNANSTKLTLTATADAVPGTYTSDIVATESSGERKSAIVTIIVTAPPTGSFRVRVSPIVILDFVEGRPQTVEYSVEPIGNFAGTVSLALSTTSNDFVTSNLNPLSVNLAAGMQTGRFNIVLQPNGEVETKDVTLTGRSGALTDDASVTCGSFGE